MTITLSFDVYGTLIDTHGVISKLREYVGSTAEQFSQTWRDKQLEYSFRRGLMQNYQDFSTCTRNALDFTCSFLKVPLSAEQKIDLLEVYRTLPAFDDILIGLGQLRDVGYPMYAFSNGASDAVKELLGNAGIEDYFDGVVSVDEIKSFKPNPDVYRHFLKKTNANASSAWLISSNPFDVIGAISVGMKSVWVKRSSDAVFDPWGIEPTAIIANLKELNGVLSNYQKNNHS